jgi:hypothetical protein
MHSIGSLGQVNPIIVTPDGRVVVGTHRLCAVRRMQNWIYGIVLDYGTAWMTRLISSEQRQVSKIETRFVVQQAVKYVGEDKVGTILGLGLPRLRKKYGPFT